MKHYRVVWDGRQFCFGLGKFANVAALIHHFNNHPIISGDSGLSIETQRLTSVSRDSGLSVETQVGRSVEAQVCQ